MDISRFSDPTIIGPGIWFEMHTEAVQCINDQRKKAFVVRINNLCDRFRCIKCKVHFKKFIMTHPFEDYWSIFDRKGRDIGFYKWTWECHNNVNKFLGKTIVDLEESYEYYISESAGVCVDCGHDNHHDNHDEASVSLNANYRDIITPIPDHHHRHKNKHHFKLSSHR